MKIYVAINHAAIYKLASIWFIQSDMQKIRDSSFVWNYSHEVVIYCCDSGVHYFKRDNKI